MPSAQTTNADLPRGGPSPPTTPPDQLLHLLNAPLSQLKHPGLEPHQLEGLRSLPEAKRLKLAYALNATEPVTDPCPAARIQTVDLTVKMLGSLARFASGKPRRVSLAAFRFAAALTVIDVRSANGLAPSNPVSIFMTPTVLHLEGAAMLAVWRARSVGTSEEIIGWAAEMVLELWELAARLRQWPGKTAAELSRTQGRVSRPPKEILRQVALFHAADELAERLTAWRFGSQAAGGSGK